jgi:hypothetical protein
VHEICVTAEGLKCDPFFTSSASFTVVETLKQFFDSPDRDTVGRAANDALFQPIPDLAAIDVKSQNRI